MKYLPIALLLLLSACYGRKPDKTGLEGQPMPVFQMLALDSITHFSTQSIPTGKTAMLFSFEPWCPYCKAQTEAMVNEMDKLKNVPIYMVTASSIVMAKQFRDHYKLNSFHNVRIFIDTAKSLGSYFNDYRIPFTAIYGPDKKLRQAFIGKSNVSVIADAVQ